jgi:hypothetical protein
MVKLTSSYFNRITVAVTLSFLFAGCSGNLDGEVNANFKTADLQKAKIVVSGSAYADGQTELLMDIYLTNSDDTVVKGYRPEYEVVSGGGVITSDCSKSNESGIASCVLKATQAGVKRIRVKKVKVDLQQDVTFVDPPFGRAAMGLATAAGIRSTGIYVLDASVGGSAPHGRIKSGNYEIYGGIRSDVFSR